MVFLGLTNVTAKSVVIATTERIIHDGNSGIEGDGDKVGVGLGDGEGDGEMFGVGDGLGDGKVGAGGSIPLYPVGMYLSFA